MPSTYKKLSVEAFITKVALSTRFYILSLSLQRHLTPDKKMERIYKHIDLQIKSLPIEMQATINQNVKAWVNERVADRSRNLTQNSRDSESYPDIKTMKNENNQIARDLYNHVTTGIVGALKKVLYSALNPPKNSVKSEKPSL